MCSQYDVLVQTTRSFSKLFSVYHTPPSEMLHDFLFSTNRYFGALRSDSSVNFGWCPLPGRFTVPHFLTLNFSVLANMQCFKMFLYSWIDWNFLRTLVLDVVWNGLCISWCSSFLWMFIDTYSELIRSMSAQVYKQVNMWLEVGYFRASLGVAMQGEKSI